MPGIESLLDHQRRGSAKSKISRQDVQSVLVADNIKEAKTRGISEAQIMSHNLGPTFKDPPIQKQ